MKWKHIPLLLLALLIIGACVASPFVVSELQKHHILQSPMADSATGIASSIDIEQRPISAGEKIQLYRSFYQSGSSVTQSTQRQDNTALTDETIKGVVYDEVASLLAYMGEEIDKKELEAYTMDQCTPTTFVDRDDPARHAILWAVFLSDSHGYFEVTLDDESHKIYALTIVLQDKGPNDTLISNTDDLLRVIEGFAAYLGVNVDWSAEGFQSEMEYFSAGGQVLFIPYLDPESNTYFLMELTASNDTILSLHMSHMNDDYYAREAEGITIEKEADDGATPSA